MFRATALAAALIASASFIAPTTAWGQRPRAFTGPQSGQHIGVQSRVQARIQRPTLQRPGFQAPRFQRRVPGSRPVPDESVQSIPSDEPPGNADDTGPGWLDAAAQNADQFSDAAVLHLSGTNIYFHQAGPQPVETVIIEGWVTGPVSWDTVTVEMVTVDEEWLSMTSSGEHASDLNVGWALRYAQEGEWSEWIEADKPEHEEATVWSWRIPNHSERCQIQLRCGIQTSRYQAPGHYEHAIQFRVGCQNN